MAGARARAQQERSAGGVVYRIADGVPVFLLIQDSYQNWGFPKGHLEGEEHAEAAAVREVAEETGLTVTDVRGEVETIDWYFRFHGRLIHKVCAFFLMESPNGDPAPQQAEGITACRWVAYDEAAHLVSYANARRVLERAHAMIVARRLAP
jgi:8-oxo-dGTP pyrophosphatase MutT (NUDIX family)